MKKRQRSVLILQGGGALGAYQGGVYEALHRDDLALDWVIGTSIGAINGAVIAGNPPEHRVAKLRGLWDSFSSDMPDVPPAFLLWMPWLQAAAHSANIGSTLTNGVNGFFVPRSGALWDTHQTRPVTESSFYDTAPLKATLERFIDFDYLNSRSKNGSRTRLTMCAVNVANAAIKLFDNHGSTSITPEHVMASGALPPGFPAIKIDDEYFWDGGIYSNTPLDVFLKDTCDEDALCFMVDVWDPTEALPTNINEVMARTKSIQYASRSQEQLDAQTRIQSLHRAIQALGEQLPAGIKRRSDIAELLAQGHDRTVNVVHLILKAREGEDSFKDVDFARESIDGRWGKGHRDAVRALAHKSWLQPLPPHAGLVIHELPQH